MFLVRKNRPKHPQYLCYPFEIHTILHSQRRRSSFIVALKKQKNPCSFVSFSPGYRQFSSQKNDYENSSWLTDDSNILSFDEKLRIRKVILELYKQFGVELSVKIEDATEINPRKRAIHLFNTWGLGGREQKNGILIYVNILERRIEIVTGDGLYDIIPDDIIEYLLIERVVPIMLKDGLGAGILLASEFCFHKLDDRSKGNNVKGEKEWIEHNFVTSNKSNKKGSFWNNQNESENRKNSVPEWLGPVSIFLGFAVLSSLWGMYKKHSQLACEKCRYYPMREMEENEYLDSLSDCYRAEMALKSAVFKKYICPVCSHSSDLIRIEQRENDMKNGVYMCDMCSCHSCVVTSVESQDDGTLRNHLECIVCGNEIVKRKEEISTTTQQIRGGSNYPIGSVGESTSNNNNTSHGGGSSSGGGAGASF